MTTLESVGCVRTWGLMGWGKVVGNREVKVTVEQPNRILVGVYEEGSNQPSISPDSFRSEEDAAAWIAATVGTAPCERGGPEELPSPVYHPAARHFQE